MRYFLLNSSVISPVSFHLQFAGLKMRKWRGLISLQNILQAIGAASHLHCFVAFIIYTQACSCITHKTYSSCKQPITTATFSDLGWVRCAVIKFLAQTHQRIL